MRKKDQSLLLVGVAAAAVALWYFNRKSAYARHGWMEPASVGLRPGQSPGPMSPPQGHALGDPSDMSSGAWACNTAWKMGAIGHPAQAAPWALKCSQMGGTVPQTAAEQYT
jgi:hypothetical protein